MTKAEIVEEATRLFVRDGWRDVAVRDIANALNISPGNLTYHFPRKDDIIRAVLLERWEWERGRYQSFLEAGSTTGGCLDMFRTILRGQLDHHGILTIRYLYSAEVGLTAGTTPENERAAIFRRILEKLVENGELELTGDDITFLSAFLQLFTRGWIMDQQLDGEEDINRYLYLLAQQLYYFATDKGMASINEFLESV